MTQNGWIKIHRKMLGNEIFQYDDTAWKVFTVLLLLADHETGTLTIGRWQLGDWTKINPSTAWKALLRLEKCRMVDRLSNNKFTRISICKWEEFQHSKDNTEDNERTTTGQRKDTLQEYKNKEIINIYENYKKKICEGSTLTVEAKGKIKARLKKFNRNDLLKAMNNFCSNRWQVEHNSTRGVAWFFQTDDRIDQYINLKKETTLIDSVINDGRE